MQALSLLDLTINSQHLHIAVKLQVYMKRRLTPLRCRHYQINYRTRIGMGLSSASRPRQHSIGYMGDGFYRSKDPTKYTDKSNIQ